jgi:Icc-related predicted phosphoesterase
LRDSDSDSGYAHQEGEIKIFEHESRREYEEGGWQQEVVSEREKQKKDGCFFHSGELDVREEVSYIESREVQVRGRAKSRNEKQEHGVNQFSFHRFRFSR